MKDYPDKMTPEQARTFRDAVLNIVSQIPRGYVTTYGHIATLAGWPSHSRMVGRTLRYTPGAELLPCHRVVNNAGSPASIVRVRRHHLQAQWPRRYAAPPLGTRDSLTSKKLPHGKTKAKPINKETL